MQRLRRVCRSSLTRYAGAGCAVLALGRSPAGACDSSGCLLATRGQAGLLAKGGWRVDASFRGTEQDAPLEGRRRVDRVLRPKVDFESGRLIPGFHDESGGRERFVQVEAAYGLSRRLTLLASFPLFARRRYEVIHPPLAETYTTEGNGDLLLGARCGIGGVVAGLGIKAPTGRHRLVSPNPGSPGILDPMLQPGSGSFDVLASLAHSRVLGGLEWTATGSYQVATANDLGYRFGDEAIGTVAATRRLRGAVSASLQLKAFHKDRHSYLGVDVPSTGLTVVYLTPGVRLAAGRATTVYGFLQLPVRRSVNEAQVAPRVGYLVGVSRSF